MCDAYRKQVEILFDTDSSDLISNGLPEHAAILLSNIFSHAKKSVKIFCDSMAPEVYKSEYLRNALNRIIADNSGVEVKILICNPLSENMKKLLAGKSVLIRKVPDNIKNLDKLFHFTVADAKAFRAETKHSPPSAIGCANNPASAKVYDNLFENIWKYSSPFEL